MEGPDNSSRYLRIDLSKRFNIPRSFCSPLLGKEIGIKRSIGRILVPTRYASYLVVSFEDNGDKSVISFDSEFVQSLYEW